MAFHSDSQRPLWAARALLLLGIVLLGWSASVWIRSSWYRHRQEAMLHEPAAQTPLAAPIAAPFDRHAFAGLLEIPRIGLSEAFAEGDDTSTLDKAIGHLADTPLPWENGNSAFAGHRDQHFRPLKKIRPGDEIRLVTPRGTLTYVVTQTYIVNPDEVWVLAPTRGRELTLITCYPFSFIGHAPQRFVVKAEPASTKGGSITLAAATR
jgi:sortase A